jgi:AmmeMemoRadiSam system protein B
MDLTVREPAVAGAFYPMDRGALERQLDQMVPAETQRHDLLACVAPHAGYVYSGGVAGKLFGHLVLPGRVLVLGPNHTGAGAHVAVAPHASWHTPLGPQAVDRDLADRLISADPAFELDAGAHWREHSIEVQLPFLRRRRPDVAVLPVCVGHLDLAGCLRLGAAVAAVAAELDEPLGIVASSDMTHYRPDDVARDQDHRAIEAALDRSPEALYETVHREGITMCGVVPATIALAAANRMGAAGAHLVAYATSGETSGDFSSVVGYAGICIHR